jgi:hypothetical protein
MPRRAKHPPYAQLHEVTVILFPGAERLKAEKFNLKKRTAFRYTRRDDFPAPVHWSFSTGKVWKTTDVQRWQKKYKPPFTPGPKPRKT